MRVALTALGAAALLAALAFLFVKTASGDFRHDAGALGLLREMKELDTRWDDDVERLANDFSGASPRADFATMMGRLLGELDRSSPGPALARELPRLKAGLAEKEAAGRAEAAAHAKSAAAVVAARAALDEFDRLAAARATVARAPRLMGAAVLASELRASLGGRIDAFGDRRAAIERDLVALRGEAGAADPALAEPAERVQSALEGWVAARSTELDAWRKYSFLTLDGRIDLTARSLAASIDSALDAKDRWRAYLFAYALALLVAIGYLASRVVATQAALRLANEDLERRVADRTRDLSATLKRLQESEAQLVQTEKMSSLGQMVAGVAHEINSPLAYVKNSVATARDRVPELRDALEKAERLLATLHNPSPDPAELQACFDSLSQRLDHLRSEHALEDLDALTLDGLHGIDQIVELVTNLRNFSRLDRSKVASFNVNEGVRATLLIAKPALRNVEVEKRLGDIPSITCSPSQVNQVLLNILNNAAQAMDKPRRRITVTTRQAGDSAIAIEVEDNGKGIAAEALPRIFDPFYTTKEVGKGTGLGLSIAYKIVTQHGGHIDVRSTEGAGTAVTVTLPVNPPAELVASGGEPQTEAVHS